MRRRDFIVGLGGGAAAAAPVLWPLAARAQQQAGRMRRVGVLMNGSASDATLQNYVKAFTESLAKAGWIEGKNIAIDIRYNASDISLARIFAAQLIGLMPDVVLAASTTNLTVMRSITNATPIVFTNVSGPVEQGFVANLARPGGNMTGFAAYEFSIGGKWLDLLKKMVPGLARVAVMFNPDTSPQSNFYMRSIEAGGQPLGIAVTALPVRSTGEIEPAIANFARQPNGGLILTTDSFTGERSKFIADAANVNKVPSISGNNSQYAQNDGLMSYASSIHAIDQFRGAANYVDRILKGEKAGDLPVQNPVRYEFVINMKTAKALGLTVPLPLLGLADEVIE